MTENEIIERINKIMVNEFEINPNSLSPEATLYEKLGLDSLDSVDLIVALEKEFSFKINRAADEDKIREMRIMDHIYNFVKEKLS